ncbi:hypothetical protein A2U01_0026765, partial [Trifolium medium]|nr:hypothetical protein [Trifolium medium]
MEDGCGVTTVFSTTDDCSSGVQSLGPTPFLAIPLAGGSSRPLSEADNEVDRASDTHSG